MISIMVNKSTPSTVEEPPSLSFNASQLEQFCQTIKKDLVESRIPLSWRISPEPFGLHPRELGILQRLGISLFQFYKTQNKLYFESIKGSQPSWIAWYLDLGKPQQIVEYGRMNRFKANLPGILRPDLILTPEGMMISELDSVPGGFGLTHQLNTSYSNLGYPVIGGADGILSGFKKMVFNQAGGPLGPLNLGIVVSEESGDYLPEMSAFAKALNGPAFSSQVYRPEELFFTEDAVYGKERKQEEPLTVLYRFLELFDYKNIPKIDLLLYSTKKEKIITTPPLKAFLEEKMWFALFHHPVLQSYWEKELGEETFHFLKALIPKTWILDPRELPPYGIIPGLIFRQKQISQWKELYSAGQKERRLVIKPSGFSELAWGARGVKIGHDLSNQDWQKNLENALSSFYHTPHILQEYHQGKKEDLVYLSPGNESLVKMTGRVRLCPYYFITGEEIVLGGVLATICPSDKKIIHGMNDAIMAPCSLKKEQGEK
ncbi:MAG: hypothetical protein ACYDBV_08755 [Nitrospiria bacterium]